jgi:peptide/nickel transport system permease protein
MTTYILRRILGAIPLIFGLLTITFFIVRLAPGDPTSMFIDPNIDSRTAEQLKENFGLNDPLPIQYGKWLGVLPPFHGVLEGEFGVSFSKQRPVFEIISEALINTLILTIISLIVDMLVGVPIGIFSALRRGEKLDHALTMGSLFVYSMPHFWLALMLILIFSLGLGWLPASQMHTVNAEDLSAVEYFFDLVKHMIMPVCVLGIASAASTVRYMRSSMLEVIRQDYIRTARAKGLSEQKVIWKHALRNALLPLITIIGLSFPFLLSGAVITEVIFAWPGMGRVTIDAIFSRDYPLIIANTFVAGIVVIGGNLLADILYAVADPRVRLN